MPNHPVPVEQGLPLKQNSVRLLLKFHMQRMKFLFPYNHFFINILLLGFPIYNRSIFRHSLIYIANEYKNYYNNTSGAFLLSLEFKVAIFSIPVIVLFLGLLLIISGTIGDYQYTVIFGWIFVVMGVLFQFIWLVMNKNRW